MCTRGRLLSAARGTPYPPYGTETEYVDRWSGSAAAEPDRFGPRSRPTSLVRGEILRIHECHEQSVRPG